MYNPTQYVYFTPFLFYFVNNRVHGLFKDTVYSRQYCICHVKESVTYKLIDLHFMSCSKHLTKFFKPQFQIKQNTLIMSTKTAAIVHPPHNARTMFAHFFLRQSIKMNRYYLHFILVKINKLHTALCLPFSVNESHVSSSF